MRFMKVDQRFRWGERLHLKSDFSRVFKQGRRVSDSGLTMWVFRHPEGGSRPKPRLGLAIPKAYGNAVARNRVKRLIREAFRLNKNQLPPGVDMVFSAKPSLVKPRFQTIEPLVIKLWTLARLRPPSPSS